MGYDDLRRELQEIDAEISEHEAAQEKTARDIVQADIKSLEAVAKARLTQIGAKLKGLYARKTKLEEALESAAIEDTISRARQDEVTALQEAYNELSAAERDEQQRYNDFCAKQADELRAFLEKQKADRSTANQPLREIAQQRFKLYQELHFQHGVEMTAPKGRQVNHIDLARVMRRLFASDLDIVS